MGRTEHERAEADTVSEPDPSPEVLELERLRAATKVKLFGPATAPTSIGRYRIVRSLGMGGMGIVYLAHDDVLDRPVAVKVLRTTASPGSSDVERLVREAKAMARLSHPNVVHVYEVGWQGAQVFIAMEYVLGQTLQGWSEAERSVDEIVAVHRRAGRGLEAAHAAGLVHRDYKPHNVMVGASGRVCVLDFGLARPEGFSASEAAAGSTRHDLAHAWGDLTQTGVVLGTPAYMSPEQLAGRPADARSDQFSFCVTLFEALYGVRPFGGGSFLELSRNVLAGRIRDVEPARAAVPPAVDQAIRRGLSTRPEDRFPAMAALLEALEPRASAGPSRRWRAAAVALVGLAIVGVIGWWRGGQGDAAPSPAPRDGSTSSPYGELLAQSNLPEPIVEPGPDDPHRVTSHRLDNGLTVYIAPDHDAPMLTAGVVIRAGSIDEAPGESGIAHLLAYSMFGGTDRIGALDPERERPLLEQRHALTRALERTEDPDARRSLLARIEELMQRTAPFVAQSEYSELVRALGGTDFDFTLTPTMTLLPVTLPRARLSAWAALEAERLRHPTFRSLFHDLAAIDEELGWSTGEGRSAHMRIQARLFEGTPFERPTVGALEDVGRPPLSAMEEFHRAYYVPNNMAIVLVGDVDAETTLPIIEQAFGDWEPRARPERPAFPGSTLSGRVQLYSESLTATPVLSWSVPRDGPLAQWERLDPALEVLSRELSERLEGTCASVRVWRRYFGLVVVLLPAPGVSEELAERRLFAALRELRTTGPRVHNLQAVDAHRRMLEIRSGRSTRDRMREIAEGYARAVPRAEVVVARHAPVTADRVERLTAHLLESGFVATYGGGGDEPAEPREFPRVGNIDYPATARSPFARQILEMPTSSLEPRFVLEGRHYQQDPETSTLSGEVDDGLSRLVLEFPLSSPDDTRLCLLARLWARGVARGTLDSPLREDWASEVVLARARCHPSVVRVDVEVLDAHADAAWASIARWLSEPVVRSDDLERATDLWGSVDQPGRRSDEKVASALEAYALYGENSAYLAFWKGVRWVLSQTPSQLSAHVRALFLRSPRVIYAGSMPPPAVVERFEGRSRSQRERSVWSVQRFARPKLLVIDDASEGNAEIRILLTRDAVEPEDAVYVDLLEAYLGDRVSGFLYDELRASRALVYIIHAETRVPSSPGDDAVLRVEVSAEHHNVVEVIATAWAAIRHPIEPGSFDATRAVVEAAYRGRRIHPAFVPFKVARWQGSGFDADPLLTRWPALPRATRERLDAFKSTFTARSPIITIRGDLDRIGLAGLERFGDVEIVTVDQVFGRG